MKEVVVRVIVVLVLKKVDQLDWEYTQVRELVLKGDRIEIRRIES